MYRQTYPYCDYFDQGHAFILKRTPFARAWGAIAGLELRIGDRAFHSSGIDEKLLYIDQGHRVYQAAYPVRRTY